MAIVIESTTIGTWSNTNTSHVLAKPSGLVIGDLMLLVLSTSRAATLPSGFTEIIGTAVRTVSLNYSYKIATSADVAASDFTYTTATNAITCGMIYRLSGASEITLNDSFLIEEGGGSGSPSEATSLTPLVTDTLLIMALSTYDASNNVNTSAYTVTGGTNPTWTERIDSGFYYGSGFTTLAVADGTYDSVTEITNIACTIDDTCYREIFGILVIHPKTNATGTNTLLENTNFIPAPSAQSGTNGTVTDLLVGTPTIQVPISNVDQPIVWTNEARVSTTWTNESQ